MGLKLAQAKPLEDRIAILRAEIDAFIDAKAAELKVPNLPLQWIRDDLTKGACQCRAYLSIQEKDAAARRFNEEEEAKRRAAEAKQNLAGAK